MAGWTGDGTSCTNADECTTGTHNCDSNAVCVDSNGGFSCMCKPGFDGDGVTCTGKRFFIGNIISQISRYLGTMGQQYCAIPILLLTFITKFYTCF